jgi:hypothetical protein
MATAEKTSSSYLANSRCHGCNVRHSMPPGKWSPDIHGVTDCLCDVCRFCGWLYYHVDDGEVSYGRPCTCSRATKAEEKAKAKVAEKAKAKAKPPFSRVEFLAIAKNRAHEALRTRGSMSAAMSFLDDIQKSRGTAYELYPKGHLAEQMCLKGACMFDAAFIDGHR